MLNAIHILTPNTLIMKPFLTAVAIVVLTVGTARAQGRFGILAGLNVAHISSNDDDINSDKQAMPSWRLGLVTQLPMGMGWAFQPQVLLQGKGTGIAHQGHTDKTRFTSLDLPLAFVYQGAGGFYLGGGPNLGFNLAASEKADDGVEKLELGSKPGQLNRFDFGVDLRAGVRLKTGLTVGLNYLKGLSNISNTPGLTWNNNVWGLSVGYFLPGKSK
ncbi:MAG: PorT family protein [Chitinophagia bacterium]|nr:PorT family protein [Chitinophagia bacterium]